MKNVVNALCLFTLCIGMSRAQQTVICGSSDINGCAVSSGYATLNSTGNLQWVTSSGGATLSINGTVGTLYGVQYESRKDTPPHTTIEMVRAAVTPWRSLRLAPVGYIERAQRIQMESAGVDEALLLKAINEEHMDVYPFAKVDDYLYRKALKQGSNMRWVWEPMRAVDKSALLQASHSDMTSGLIVADQYAHEIPDRVLADVERFMDCAPKDTVFLVSDYKAVNPDPFLAVTTPRLLAIGKVYIIDQWDEPGFGTATETHTMEIASR